MKIPTNIQIKGFVRLKLATDPVWAAKALIRIYQCQTLDEQNSLSTKHYNGIGFTGVDGKILSSIAKQLLRYGRISDKQMNIVLKKMPKYWSQIIELSDREKLLSLIPTEI